jgi:hypothetical protein
MKRFLTLGIILLALLPGSYLCACTGFSISKGDLVMVGNNEDWKNPNTKVWYVPAEEGKYGRVYFGFDNFYPQGGMNEKGLVFDGFATAPNKVKKSLDKPAFSGNLMDKVMSECATVNETLEIFSKYNLAFLERAMFFIADANGDSAIIEGDDIVRKKGKYQVCTNFYQSRTRKKNITCDRYKIATAMLEDADDVSVDLGKRVLAATHNEGPYPTVYSNVYDLKRRIVYLYHFHNFQNEVVIDLKTELAKGARRLDLPDLFPRTFIAESFKNSSIAELEKRKAEYTYNVAAQVLNSYVGQYWVDTPEGDKTIVTVTTAGGKLFAEVEGQGKMELLAASDNDFAVILPNQTIKVTIEKDNNDEVEKIRIDTGGQISYANRVK